jgi:hypothetical protein
VDGFLAYLAPNERWERFLTPGELDHELGRLHEASGGQTSVDVIGESRGGHPIRMLTVGNGDRHAVVVGTPHPNEPTGGLATLRLAELLLADRRLRDELGLVWHVLPCVDPDGMRLNDGWFAGPFTYTAYGTSLYRPPFPEQFEWTFHRADLDRPGLPAIPESMAVMTLVDSVRPELFVSMHNGEIGGVYCYLTRAVPSIGATLAAMRAMTHVPIECGEPELVADRLAPGVFHVPANTDGGPHMCSTDYAARYGALGVISEPPLWADPRSEDQRPTTRTRAEAADEVERARVRVRDEHGRWVDVIATELSLDTVRGRAVLQDAAGLDRDWPANDPVGDEVATTAYVTGLAHELDVERVRAAGHVIALLTEQPDGSSPRQRDVLAAATRRLAEWAGAAEERTTFVGLDGAVRCQVGIALSCAATLAHEPSA